MIAALLIGAIALTALVVASTLHLRGFVQFLLTAYLAGFVETTLLTTALSPMRWVTRAGLGVSESALLLGALAAWWLRGRPRPPKARPARWMRELRADPVLAAFALVVGCSLAYEFALGLTVPPNNWDSLTYHLARAAAWAQHGGVYWIPNAPTDRMNEFQPLAEQQDLFLFVATGRGALYALPQFVAELATMLGIYGIARGLRQSARTALYASLLFATGAIVALEATTGQNDLVAASLATVAGALLLAGGQLCPVLAGIAVGLGLGVKLTLALVLPALVVLAAVRGRRSLARFAIGAASGFVALGWWSYLRNLIETGRVLGHGGGRVEHTTSPSFPGSLATAFRILYRFLDLSGFSGWTVSAFALAAALSLAWAVVERRRSSLREGSLARAGWVALPLCAPLLIVLLAGAAHVLARALQLPVNDPATTSARFVWGVNRGSEEDVSAFGPLGLLLLAAPCAVLVRARWRGWRSPAVPFALALPVFVVVLALGSKYNPWLSRFLIVPAALTAPLLAPLFSRRGLAVSTVMLASVAVVLVHVRNGLKPISGGRPLPWQLTQAEAVDFPWLRGLTPALELLNRQVPGPEQIGALVHPDDPSYLLYGPRLERRVVFLRIPEEWRQAQHHRIRHIVIVRTDYQDAQARLKLHGWRLEPLSTYWVLASRVPRMATATAPHS